MKLPSTFVKDTENVNVIIEAPRGSGSKYIYDEQLDLFRLKKILPRGIVFPYHFGFIPYTLGEDKDPLDILVLMDEPAYPGCLIECKLAGVIIAEQTAGDIRIRNDRFLAFPLGSEVSKNYRGLEDITEREQQEIGNFLISYTKLSNKDLSLLGINDACYALELIKKQQVNGNN